MCQNPGLIPLLVASALPAGFCGDCFTCTAAVWQLCTNKARTPLQTLTLGSCQCLKLEDILSSKRLMTEIKAEIFFDNIVHSTKYCFRSLYLLNIDQIFSTCMISCDPCYPTAGEVCYCLLLALTTPTLSHPTSSQPSLSYSTPRRNESF